MKINAIRCLTVTRQKGFCSILLAALSLSLGSNGFSQDLNIQKLFGKWVNPPANFKLGEIHGSLAASEKWIIVGAPSSSEPENTINPITNRGALQVFNAVTGAWTRKIIPIIESSPTTNIQFGYCCVIAGDLVLIGAPDFSNATAGSVYVYNLSTGALVRKLTPDIEPATKGANGDRFGSSIAVVGNLALIGSPADDAGKGSAYIYDFVSGLHQGSKLVDGSGIAGDRFGESVAVDGNIGIIGAPNMGSPKTGGFIAFDLSTRAELKRVIPAAAALNDNIGGSVAIINGTVAAGATQNGTSNGKVFTHNLISSAERVLTASDGATGDNFGASLAAQNGLLLVGAPGDNSGAGSAYAFHLNATTNNEFTKLSPFDQATKSLGASCAVVGNTAIVAASNDSTAALNVGAVLVYKSLTHSSPLTQIATKGHPAPGAENILYNAFGDVSVNPDGELGFVSSLTGTGSNGSKDTAFFDNLTGNGLDLIAKSRDSAASGSINVITRSLFNDPARAIFQATLSNSGLSTAITSSNNQIIFSDNGTVAKLFQSGDSISEFPIVLPATLPGAKPLSFLQLAQSSNSAAPRLSFTCSLGLVTNATTAVNDSGLVTHNFMTTEAQREGALAFIGGPTYGQFTPRVAQQDSLTVFSTAVGTVAASNQAVFAKNFGAATVLIAQKGNPISDAAGAVTVGVTYASLIGESADATNVLYRGTIAGSTGNVVPATSNEALWLHNGTLSKLILRKGIDLAPIAPGVRIAKFISFWQTNGQQLALVQLIGTGVTAANDQALVLVQSSPLGPLNILLREGQPAPGCGRATIGVISRVEVAPKSGSYLVQTTLLGAPTGTDLALFRGASSLPVTSTTETLRRPYLILRKGQLFNNQPSKVKSFSLPTTNLTVAGAGATGLSSAIAEAASFSAIPDIALIVEYDNGVRQVMKGTP